MAPDSVIVRVPFTQVIVFTGGFFRMAILGGGVLAVDVGAEIGAGIGAAAVL